MYYFIINPNSGKGNAELIWENISNELNHSSIEYKFSKTECEKHAVELARNAVLNGHKRIICVGGDGTLNEIVNGIMTQSFAPSSEITIGMVPTGTGNDWCRSHKIPAKSPDDALQLILNGNKTVQDIGKINFKENTGIPRYFINVAGIGFDAIVADNVNFDKKLGKTGAILFFKNLIKSLVNSKVENMNISIDEKQITMKVFTMAVGIGKYNGGGMMQLPDAVMNDGLFDITIISDISKFDIIRYTPLLFNGKFVKHPKVFRSKGKEIFITSTTEVLVETEGEIAGTLPVKIEIIHNAVNVFSGLF